MLKELHSSLKTTLKVTLKLEHGLLARAIKATDTLTKSTLTANPMTTSIRACQIPKFGIESKVLLFLCLFRRNSAKANENQMQTKPNFFTGGERRSSMTSRPERKVRLRG